MPTLTKDGVSVTTTVPREIVTLRSQGFAEQTDPAEPVEAAESLEALKVEDLRKELADRQLPVSGKKAELIERLAGAEQPAPAETEPAVPAPASE